MEVVAARNVKIGTQTFRAGDDVKGLSPRKVSQLIEQRILRLKDEVSIEYVVTKTFTVKNHLYSRGNKIRVKKLTPEKLHQLLEQRYLEPAPANG